MMSKETLETNKAALELLLSENNDKATDYKAQLAQVIKDLEDLDKPKVTSLFLDTLNEVITEAIENLDLEDGVTCDFELDYDNRVTMSDIRFDDIHQVADKIYCAVENLFAEIKEKENK